MSPGQLVRTLLGDRRSRVAGRAYRALFVDLDKATQAIASQISTGAHVLDVGGGDGEPLNLLLDRRPDISVTTIDVADVVGRWIAPSHLGRVTRLPRTTLSDYAESGRPMPDVLLISDVMHHIPVAQRDAFMAAIAAMLGRLPSLRIIVKDVEPGHWRATLGRLSDHYVTGDRGVSLIGRSELIDAMRRAHAPIRWHETGLFASDPPNYALVFQQ